MRYTTMKRQKKWRFNRYMVECECSGIDKRQGQ